MPKQPPFHQIIGAALEAQRRAFSDKNYFAAFELMCVMAQAVTELEPEGYEIMPAHKAELERLLVAFRAAASEGDHA
jgi:hypothetical protein